MKKLILSIVLLAACTLTLSAARSPQNDGNSVSVTGTEVVRTGDNIVSVVFKLHVGDGVTDKNHSLIIRPVLRGVGGESELSSIIIRGARAKVLDENRAMSAAGVQSEGRYITSNGTELEYYAQIPWQSWMTGSQLIFNGLNAGKGTATEVNIGVVASNLLMDQIGSVYASDAFLADAPTTGVTTGNQAIPQTVPQRQGSTVGDELAARFTFVEPVARYIAARDASSLDAVFDYNMPLVFGTGTTRQDDDVSRFVEMTRQGAIRIGFDRGSSVVNRALGENNKMLVDLISSLRVLETNPDMRIAQVVVVGFSAPEGNDEKETLAMERAGATRNFLTGNSRIDPDVISVYNGSVDWVTLRALIAESNMPEKYKVLEIIDNVPEWRNTQDKGRMAYLMELGGGGAFNHIRQNFFPQLRQTGAYVKVYYETVQ